METSRPHRVPAPVDEVAAIERRGELNIEVLRDFPYVAIANLRILASYSIATNTMFCGQGTSST